MRPSAVCLAGLAAQALASGASITAALAAVQADTTALGVAFSAWRGDVFGALPIVAKAATLYGHLRKGARTASASPPLSFDESLAVVAATGTLAAEVNKTLEAAIVVKPKFDRLFLTPILHMSFDVKKDATDDLGAKIVAKVPEKLRGIARQLIGGIDDSFDKAYSLKL